MCIREGLLKNFALKINPKLLFFSILTEKVVDKKVHKSGVNKVWAIIQLKRLAKILSHQDRQKYFCQLSHCI